VSIVHATDNIDFIATETSQYIGSVLNRNLVAALVGTAGRKRRGDYDECETHLIASEVPDCAVHHGLLPFSNCDIVDDVFEMR
jgi:hypothetical protein